MHRDRGIEIPRTPCEPPDGNSRAKRDCQRPGRSSKLAACTDAHSDAMIAVKTLGILLKVHGTLTALMGIWGRGFRSLTVAARLGIFGAGGLRFVQVTALPSHRYRGGIPLSL